jgi:SREBP cleavage-activation protein with sterol-sensing domain
MNAVLAYPPQMSTTLRIANALGDVGHLSLAATGQNLAILWLLYNVVSPGVQAFCIFAAAALIFDFFFHLIFFVAVLSVDVRRVELQDSIDKFKETRSKTQRLNKSRQYWLGALLQGRLPFSSRIAFPAVFICFILGLNVQFSDSESLGRLLINGLLAVRGQLTQSPSDTIHAFAPPINQARTPQSWLRLQNHQTAEEVIRFVKPSAHTIIARIYDPLAIVLHGSDRGFVPADSQSLVFLWEALNRHTYNFLLVLIFTIGVVTLLMQYLLWNEVIEDEDDATPPKSTLVVKRLPYTSELDIFRMVASEKGDIITIDHTRKTRILAFNSTSQAWIGDCLRIEDFPIPFFPNSCLTIDKAGSYGAFADTNGWVGFWNLSQRRLVHFYQFNPWCRKPILFELLALGPASPEPTVFVVLLQDGQLMTYNLLDKSEVKRSTFRKNIHQAVLTRTSRGIQVVALSQEREILTMPMMDDVHESLRINEPDTKSSEQAGVAKLIIDIPALSLVGVVRSGSVDFVDVTGRLLVYRVLLSNPISRSVRIMPSSPKTCPICHNSAVYSISFAYTDTTSKNCCLQTLSANSESDNSVFCFRQATNTDAFVCGANDSAVISRYCVSNPGEWEVTNDLSIVGIRRASSTNSPSVHGISHSKMQNSKSSSVQHTTTTEAHRPTIRFRLSSSSSSASSKVSDSDAWEVWSLSSAVDFDIAPLGRVEPTDLFVSKPGPIAALGKRSMAVVLGNVIRVVTVGGERIEEGGMTEWYASATKGHSKADGRRRRVLR